MPVLEAITHPNLPSNREGICVVVQLTHTPRPLREREEFVSELCELRNSGEGLTDTNSNTKYVVIQSPTSIQGRRIPKTFKVKEILQANAFRMTALLEVSPTSADSILLQNSTSLRGQMFGLVSETTGMASLRGNSHLARSNPEQILLSKTVGWVKPNNNNMDCHVAPAPRNDAELVVLTTNQDIYPRNDAMLGTFPRPFGERKEFQVELKRNLEIRVRGCQLKLAGEGSTMNAHTQLAVIQSPIAIQGRRIPKTLKVKEILQANAFRMTALLALSPRLCENALTSLAHCPQKEVLP